ncbi:recombination protein NinG [Pseudomonas luteola]|uniref:recombination protein NinG n=1 Tax=Pseudomonas luteola TaxID=47886 RepID=UPI003A85F45D
MSTAIQTKASGIQASPRKLKKKKCKNPTCRAEFIPARPLQAACSVPCALQMAAARSARVERENVRKEKAEAKEARKKLKSRSEYMKEAQAVINRYVRLRDSRLGCVSCNKAADWQGQWHASHFRSVGAAPHLRFNLNNIHKACSVCNNYLSGNIIGYRPELVRRIGEAKVEALESAHFDARYTIEYLKRLKAVFAKKCRRIESMKEAA